jgi:CXCXC repeat
MAREEGFFDDLARGLADGSVTRGKALRLMGAAVVGGTLGSFGISGVAVADDECKPTGKKCRKNKQCCSGNCSGGTCAACPSGQVLCGGSCVSNGCPTGQTFNSSTCKCECPSGQVLCNGSCVSTSCPQGQIFDPSSCACVAQCLPDTSQCTADAQCCSGICDSRSFPDFCSGCRFPGGSCAAGETCCDVGSVNPSTCVNGKCCAPEERPCNANTPCCPGLMCIDLGFGPICIS